VKVRVPVTAPVAVGENVTLTLQLAWAATLVPQVLLFTLKPELATTLVILSATLWLFVRITVFDVLVAPTATIPKFSVVGESVTGALPVPVSVTV
jgi:hypothetical protein